MGEPVIKANTNTLTKRESEVLNAIAAGFARRLEIAAHLSISSNVVGIHLTRLLSKGETLSLIHILVVR